MIRASTAETRNRLSHFIRLVRGENEVAIMGRNTPVVRIVHVSRAPAAEKKASWTVEGERGWKLKSAETMIIATNASH